MYFSKRCNFSLQRCLQRVPGGAHCPAPVAVLLVWSFCFVLVFPLVWAAGFAVVEWTLIGDVREAYPRSAAFVTLVTGSSYVRGARVLAHTLRMHNVRDYALVALEVGLTEEERGQLRSVGWSVRTVQPIPFFPANRDKAKWRWVPAERLGAVHIQALTKMRVWDMDEFERIVFIDSDAWTVGDVCSHLCRRGEELAAMGNTLSDVNSGVMSLRPDHKRFLDMMYFWEHEPEKFFHYRKRGQADNVLPNPDQSLIIGYFKSRGLEIGPLSQRYNLNCRLASDANTRILHFNVDVVKPWAVSRAEAEQRMKEGGDLYVWRYVLDWINLEERVDEVFPRGK